MFQCDTVDRVRFLQRDGEMAGQQTANIDPRELCFIRNTP